MNIELENFTLERFDYNNKEHMKILSKFDMDREIDKYIIKTSDSFSDIVDYYRLSDENSIYNKLYLVKNKNNEIIGEIELDGEKDDLFINYSTLEKYRNKGYAISLLKETINYLLNEIKQISLVIEKENLPSRNLARKAGFSEIGETEYGFLKYQLKI